MASPQFFSLIMVFQSKILSVTSPLVELTNCKPLDWLPKMKYELSRIFGPNGFLSVTFDDCGFMQSVFHKASIACPNESFVCG